MTGRLPIAFYAPLKSPHHPAPSGDRTMGQLLMKALTAAGFEPGLASEVRTLDKTGTRTAQERSREASADEAGRLIGSFRALSPEKRPRLWFTYHVYYKAPDWIGPPVADALGIPYCVAEGSRAGKREGGPWALGHQGAETALNRANALFVMTETDREALERHRRPGQVLVDLPPFLDRDEWYPEAAGSDGDPPEFRQPDERAEPRLLTVAMMRDGDKLASYGILAQALGLLEKQPWSLDVVGDGDASDTVERLLRPLDSRIRFHGRIEDRRMLRSLYENADVFVWPAVNEAYGMVFLEAQASGCPVVAGAYGGVSSVVRDGLTGVLAPPGDPAAFARAVGNLLARPDRRRSLSQAARAFVAEERSLSRAAERLRATLQPLVSGIAP